MKARDLHKVWGAPDNSQLTAKQYSFRLPVHVAAKLNALQDVYPSRTKTELVGDLLAAAVEEASAHLPYSAGEPDRDSYWAYGPAVDFRKAANRHYRELQRELGIEDAPPLFEHENFLIEGDEES